MNIHMDRAEDETEVEGEIDLDTMRRYVAFCKQTCAPRLSAESAELLSSHFVSLRKQVQQVERDNNERSSIPITVRQLEAIIRISESLAKITLSPTVLPNHVDEAIRLFKSSTMDAVAAGSSDGLSRGELNEEITKIDKELKRRLPVGWSTSYQSLVKEFVNGQGFSSHALERALFILEKREVIRYTAQRKVINRIGVPSNGPWTSYSLSPESRIHTPVSVTFSNGSVSNPETLVAPEPYRSLLPLTALHGSSASITLDFGKNIAGIPTITFGEGSDPGEVFGMAFAESKQFISRTSDRAMDFFVDDGALFHTIKPSGVEEWTPQYRHMRGAFRYMTLFMNTTGTVTIAQGTSTPKDDDAINATVNRFFYSSDDFLNKIWYAGAYTIQLSTIPPSTGRGHDHFMDRYGYDNSAPAGYGRAVLTDGARRDRTVWAGDRAISTTAQHYTLNDAYSSQTGIEWLFAQQDCTTGQMPYAAPPIDEWGSDTYHMWSMVVLYDTYFYAGGDKEWLLQPRSHVSGESVSLWQAAKRALQYSVKKLNGGPTSEPKLGLLWVDHKLDWGRVNQGGYNLAANSIFMKALQRMAALGFEVGDADSIDDWLELANNVKRAINLELWDEKQGMYRDNTTSTILPQDGNSLAVWFEVADNQEKRTRISEGLRKNWNEYGAVAPESPGMISTFISGFELIAHMGAGRPQKAIDLIRSMWGYVWNAPYSVQSSLIEGYYKDGRCYYPFQAYDPSYISHAHPWASGPSIVLSRNVAGLEFTNPTHTSWTVFPEVDVDLEYAVAGVSSASGKLLASGWSKTSEWSFEMAVKAPAETHGQIGVPVFWRWDQSYEIRLNGSLVASGVGKAIHALDLRESFVSDFTSGWQAQLQKNFRISTWPEDHDDVPYGIQYTESNVYGYNSGLGMKVSAFPKGSTGRVQTAEIASLREDILYGSFRMRAIVPTVPGVCFGFFTYQSETQEADIEFLSSDAEYYRTMHLTNQPGLINGDTDPDASKTVVVTDGNKQVDFTAFNEHRLDWLKPSTSYYYNGVKKQTVSKNSPSVASALLVNVWSDGGPLWTKGPPTQDAIANIYYIK
ncbi:hypothetical protein FRC07_006305, partial [Ceratobasidium sp. 392]